MHLGCYTVFQNGPQQILEGVFSQPTGRCPWIILGRVTGLREERIPVRAAATDLKRLRGAEHEECGRGAHYLLQIR